MFTGLKHRRFPEAECCRAEQPEDRLQHGAQRLKQLLLYLSAGTVPALLCVYTAVNPSRLLSVPSPGSDAQTALQPLMCTGNGTINTIQWQQLKSFWGQEKMTCLFIRSVKYHTFHKLVLVKMSPKKADVQWKGSLFPIQRVAGSNPSVCLHLTHILIKNIAKITEQKNK